MINALTRMKSIRILCSSALLFSPSALLAQEATYRRSFEVASIKVVPASVSQSPLAATVEKMLDSFPVGFVPMSGSNIVRIRSLSLASIIAISTKVRRRDIIGPSWMQTQFFDIDATMPKGAPPQSVNEMLQSLLDERYGLKYHRESKPQKGYALLVDGIFRPQVGVQKGAPHDGDGNETDRSAGAKGDKAAELQQAAKNNRDQHTSFSSFTLKNAPLTKLADALSRHVGKPVVDMTGIAGTYDFNLSFTASAGSEFDSLDESLIRTLRELGLRLDWRTVSRDLLVVDQVAKIPTAN